MLSGLWREKEQQGTLEEDLKLKILMPLTTLTYTTNGTILIELACFDRECTVKYRKEDTVVKDRY